LINQKVNIRILSFTQKVKVKVIGIFCGILKIITAVFCTKKVKVSA
jgi:hypothetical protein